MNIPDLLPYFDTWNRIGPGKFMASCPMPNHRDSEPSVSVTQDIDTGKIMMFCWGCNTKAPDLIQAMGLRLSDLFGDPGHPAAVKQIAETLEIHPDQLMALEERVKKAVDDLEFAEKYIEDRFNLTLEDGIDLRLGVDDGFGVPHLIIPFCDPSGKIVGMQGRRLVEGEPRWRSVSGPAWSKIGCFAWDREGPVIITEGPSDALAVIGRTRFPSLAIRGASNTAETTCNQIKEWLNGRQAIVIGDNGEAGEAFSRGISNGTGLPFWSLPSDFGDLCDFLSAGGSLEDISSVASEPEPVEIDTRTPDQIISDFKSRIFANLTRASIDPDLVSDLSRYPQYIDVLRLEIPNEARRNGYGVGEARSAMDGLAAAINTFNQVANPPAQAGGGGGIHANIPQNMVGANLPTIIWNAEDQLHVTEHEIRQAIDAYEGKQYYRSAVGLYVKVVDEEIVNLKESGVMSMLSQMGHWRVINGARETGHVPTAAAKLISDPSWECGLQEIKRRVEVPFMLADGTIISVPGYHEESGVFLLPRKSDQIIVPEVPAIVTDEDVALAKQILEDVTEGFVFKNEASKTNLIAMTLTSPLRELFRHNPMVPLLTSTAPQSGSGKGTSIRVPLSTCGVGPHSLATTAYNPDENEFEKKLVGKLLKKSTYIFLDNIRQGVNSSVLEQMLTAANYDGRTLGYSEVNALSTLVLWVSTLQSTGSFNRDLTRRTVPVELRKNHNASWQHKNIEAYLAAKRGDMIWACFVVARKWLQDGAPISNVRLDGYVGWTEVIGGMVEHVLGYEYFLDNLDSFRKMQDQNSMTIDSILERWLERYGEEPQPARMSIEDYEDPALHQMLGLRNPGSSRQVMNALTRILDAQDGYIVGNTHVWQPLGVGDFGGERNVKLYRCIPLEE